MAVLDVEEMEMRTTVKGTSRKFFPDITRSWASPVNVLALARNLTWRVDADGVPRLAATPETICLFLTTAHEAIWSRPDPRNVRTTSAPPATTTTGLGDAEDNTGDASAAWEQTR